MLDKIHIKKLQFFAHHGVFASEQELGQRFCVSLTCELDLKPAGLSDDWQQTVCYKAMSEAIIAFATQNRFQTLEGLAEHLCSHLLEKFTPLQTVTLIIEKPAAAIPAIFDTVCVEITRSRV